MALAQSLNGPMNDPIGALGGVLREPSVQKRGAKARELTEPLMRAESEARTDLEKTKAAARKEQITKEEGLQKTFVTGLTQAQTAYESELGQQPERTITAFNPERATELAVLTAIMGAFAGSISGRAGLSAMKGVSEGYRTGQEDLYKREVDNYEAALGQYKQKIAEAKQIYDNAVKLETEERGRGMIELKKLDPLLQDSVITAHAKVQNLKGVGDSLREALKLVDQLEKTKVEAGLPRASSQQIKTAQVRGSDGKNYLVDVNSFLFGSDPAQANARGVIGPAAITAGEPGSRERIFAGRVFSAIKNMAVDAKNLLSIPSTAAMPELAGIVAEEPNSVFRALVAMTARTITEPEKRAFQQITEQVAKAMADIEGQGLASGSTLAKVKSFAALRPGAGDNALNMALYFARIRQELETGIEVFLTNYGANEEQKRQAKELYEKLPSQIPFTVDDVFKAFQNSTNVNKTLTQDLQSLVRSAPALLGVQAPQDQTQQPQQGKAATMGNVRATARARNITEDEAKALYQQRGYTISGE